MMIGVSWGRYIWSSLTHLETLLHDSKSVMSYTINAPNYCKCQENLIRDFSREKRKLYSYHVLLDNRLC